MTANCTNTNTPDALGEEENNLSDSEQSKIQNPKSKISSLGSPCSRGWSVEWFQTVNAAETSLGRRICGARTIAGLPCTLPPNHPNGRCAFHGGFDVTGAPKGNRNAMLHGLYSRRLRQCDPKCPHWQACPCANEQVAQLKPVERPTCPYEQTEYNVALTDLDEIIHREQKSDPNPYLMHIAHDLAMLHVLINRAAFALRDHPHVDDPNAFTSSAFSTGIGNVHEIPPLKGDKGGCSDSDSSPSSIPNSKFQIPKSPRTSPYLSAYLRLFSEYRRSLRLILPKQTGERSMLQTLRYFERAYKDTDLEPSTTAITYPTLSEPPSQDELADTFLKKAIENAKHSEKERAAKNFRIAWSLRSGKQTEFIDKIGDAWVTPPGTKFDKEYLKHYLRDLLPT